MILGYLIGIAIISAVSALFLKLSAKLVVKKSVGFAIAFIISFVSVLAAGFVQDLTDHKQSPFWTVSPAIVFFLSCWLLNALFVKYGGESVSLGYARAFPVTALQCAGLFVFMLVLSLVFVGGLLFYAGQSN